MEEFHIPAPNPYYSGLRIKDKDDLFPSGFSPEREKVIFEDIGRSARDIGLLSEAPEFAEADDYYNPGQAFVENDFILEAITVDRFSRTGKRMKAVVRVLNRHLGDSQIAALDPVVGRPKKSGSFAYVTVQLPFSDGQVVSVVFHSPEGDRQRIAPDDTIIAFRWLLNKRDITHVVAPEEGAEVSLESIARRIVQLVVKNSARFERTQKDAMAERQELEHTREAVKAEEDRQAELMDSIVALKDASDALDARIASREAALESQKRHNAELEAKLAALKAEREAAKQEPEGTGQEEGSLPPVPESEAAPEPDPAQPEQQTSPAFIATLNDILAGKHDADSGLVGNLLDAAAEEAERSGEFSQYESLFQSAADRLTALLKKRAA